MQLLVNGLIAGSLASLIAGGLSLVYGVLGVFNLALGQMVLLGGYLVWWLHQSVGLPLIPSLLLGLGMSAVVSWGIFRVFIVPFYRRHRFLPLLTTIACSLILDGLLLILFEERPRSILPGLRTGYTVLGASFTLPQVVLVCVTLVLLVALAYVLHSTRIGRQIRATVQHPHAASSLGVRTSLLHAALFVGSGLLAACGGIFIGIDQSLTPTLAFPLTIKAYAAVIAGGKGNVWGTVICAYVIALLEQLVVGVHWFGVFYVAAGYQETVALAVIIGFLLLRPNGLSSSSRVLA